MTSTNQHEGFDMLNGRITALRRHGALSFLDLTRGEEVTNVRVNTVTIYESDDGTVPRVGDIVEISGAWELDKKGHQRLFGVRVRRLVRPGQPTWDPPTPQPTPELESALRQLWPGMLRMIRAMLASHGHVELLTPTLNRYFVGGASMPLFTDSRGGDRHYLRVTSEIALKGHVAQRLEPVYEIGAQYRNTQRGPWQSPEFISLEAYAPFQGLAYARTLLVEIIQRAMLVKDPAAGTQPCSEHDAGIVLWPSASEEEMRLLMRNDACTMGSLERACKERLPPGVTVVMDLPAILSPLYRQCDDRPHRSRRAWICIDGVPVADLGEEEYDIQRLRCQLQSQQGLERRSRITRQHPTSGDDLLAVVESGLPPLVGMSLSLSRVAAILTEARTIHDTHMRPRPWRRSGPR